MIRGVNSARGQAEQRGHRLPVLALADGVRVVVRAAFHQYELLGFLGGFVQLAAQLGWIRRSSLPCTTKRGEPISPTLRTDSKRCVISGDTGSQPQRKVLTTSGMLVKVPSTIVPCSSCTWRASSMAMAPPSEWPKM